MESEARPEVERAARFFPARIGFTLGLGVLGLWIISGFLPALIWAAIIAIAIDPLFLKIRKRAGGRHRGWLALGGTLAVGVILLAPIALGVSQLAQETKAIVAWVVEAQRHGIPVPEWTRHLPMIDDYIARWWDANLATPEDASDLLERWGKSGWRAQSQLIGKNIIHRTVIFLFTLISLFFLLLDRDSIVRQCRVAAIRLLGAKGEDIATHAVQSVRGTIDGLVLVGIGEGAIMTVVYLVLGVPSALLIGLLTAVAAIIPFGAAVMFVVAAAALLAQGQAVAAVLVIVIGLTVVGIADHFVRPAMIGGATKLPFLWVLVGILGGVETYGLLGLFVGPSTMAILYLLWCEFMEERPAPEEAEPA
jgi:predicted PurR-regulated permease PerM